MDKMFLNSDVARIVGVTQRQVLGWSEKGLIIPHSEAAGAGVKRNYDYSNLLEFALCKSLFSMGMGVQKIKRILSELREGGDTIQDWAVNFSAYYKKTFKYKCDQYLKLKKELELENDPMLDEFSVFADKFIKKGPEEPKEPTGILLCFFGDEGDEVTVMPWDIDFVLSYFKKELGTSSGSLIIDLGKIKKAIDKNL